MSYIVSYRELDFMLENASKVVDAINGTIHELTATIESLARRGFAKEQEALAAECVRLGQLVEALISKLNITPEAQP